MNKDKHENIREIILDKAESIIASNGVLSLKISDLTKGVGISTTLFYTLFKTKEDILVSLAIRSFRQSFSMRWWLSLSTNSGLEKFIAYILEEIKFIENRSFYSAISTISCNELIYQNVNPAYLQKLNHLARCYWETPIQLLFQAREQKEIEATDAQIHQICYFLCTYLRGRELLNNTYIGKEYSEGIEFNNADFIERALKDICPERQLNMKTLNNAQELRRKLLGYKEGVN